MERPLPSILHQIQSWIASFNNEPNRPCSIWSDWCGDYDILQWSDPSYCRWPRDWIWMQVVWSVKDEKRFHCTGYRCSSTVTLTCMASYLRFLWTNYMIVSYRILDTLYVVCSQIVCYVFWGTKIGKNGAIFSDEVRNIPIAHLIQKRKDIHTDGRS